MEKKQASKPAGRLLRGDTQAFDLVHPVIPPRKPMKDAEPSKKIEPTDEGKVIKRKLRK